MSFKSIAMFVSLLSTTAASAAEVISASYDSSSKIISVDVRYGGGCEEHTFTAELGACRESFPVQCTLTLIEDSNGDLCEALIFKTIELDAKELGLLDSYFEGARVTIVGDDDTRATITLPMHSAPATVTSYSCPTGRGKSIQFIPEYGEVHFLNADGSDASQHDDGLNFDELVLESHPAQYQTTIIDDEGNRVGGWKFLSTSTTFTAIYRGTKYTSCRAD